MAHHNHVIYSVQHRGHRHAFGTSAPEPTYVGYSKSVDFINHLLTAMRRMANGEQCSTTDHDVRVLGWVKTKALAKAGQSHWMQVLEAEGHVIFNGKGRR